MFIITMFEVNEAQRLAIGQALGLRGLASQDQVRSYLQKHGELHLLGLTLPVPRSNPLLQLADKPSSTQCSTVGA